MALGGGQLATYELSELAQHSIDEFARLPSVRVYETRRGARGRCHAASVAFALWLRVAGVENRIVRFAGPRPGLRRHLSEFELEAVDDVVQHAVLIEGRTVVDFTWRMWSSAHPHPRMSPLEEYGVDFATRDESVCGVCGRYRLFNGTMPPCRHLTPDGERRVVERLRVALDADAGIVARRLIAEGEDARFASFDAGPG
jgi:hypothetical protein